jgi:hypothetical protein
VLKDRNEEEPLMVVIFALVPKEEAKEQGNEEVAGCDDDVD